MKTWEYKYKVGDIVSTKRTSGIVREQVEDNDIYDQLVPAYEVEWADGTIDLVKEKELQ